MTQKGKAASKRTRGRPPFDPTEEQRLHVKLHTAYGTPQRAIAEILHITLPTLRRHFKRELDIGNHEANATVANSVYQQAIGAPAQFDANGNQVRAEVGRDIRAAIFWLKTRAGWREADTPAKRKSEPSKRLQPPPVPREKVGKKEERERAAQRIGGKFAPPAGPTLVVSNDSQ